MPIEQLLRASADRPRKKSRMGPDAVAAAIRAFKSEGIDLVVTLPEEPTFSLNEATREDPYFTTVTAASEGSGIATCAGAALSGRPAVFITGIAGLLVGAWALAQMGRVYGAPFLVVTSYRGDFGDATGIPGTSLAMFKRVAEPLLRSLDLPYRIVDRVATLEKAIVDAHFACKSYGTPVVLLLSGEVVW